MEKLRRNPTIATTAIHQKSETWNLSPMKSPSRNFATGGLVRATLVLPVRMTERPRVGLLIDREHLLAVLDALKASLVHVERGELDLLADACLADCVSGAVRVRGADRNEAVDARVFQKVGLNRLSHRGGVAEARRRQWQLGRFAALLRDPVGDAFATVFSIGGARQGVDAEHVLDAMAAEILAASDAGHVLVTANVIHRAEALCGVHSSGVVDYQWNVRGGDLLKGGVLGLSHPVR